MIVEGRSQQRVHRPSEIGERQSLECAAFGEIAAGFEPVGEVENLVQPAHPRARERVTFDRLQHATIDDGEFVARDRRTERRVQYDRIAPRERIDRDHSAFALCDEVLCIVQPRDVVQHARDARANRIFAVGLREPIGEPRDPDRVPVAMTLTEPVPNAMRQRDEIADLGRPPHDRFELFFEYRQPIAVHVAP